SGRPGTEPGLERSRPMTAVAAMTPRPRLPWFVGFLGKRLIWALITLFIFLTAVFFFMQVWVPYSWATQFTQRGPEAVAAARAAAGLDQPLHEQYVEFIFGLARGDLGASFSGPQVIDLIRRALPVTLTVF